MLQVDAHGQARGTLPFGLFERLKIDRCPPNQADPGDIFLLQVARRTNVYNDFMVFNTREIKNWRRLKKILEYKVWEIMGQKAV